MKRLALAAMVIALACPWSASAQPTTRYVGPHFPILVDTNGDGLPTESVDTPIVPLFDGTSTLTIPNPWESCGPATHNVFSLTTGGGLVPGAFTGGSRSREGQTETLVADQFSNGRPVRFAMEVDKPGFPDKSGVGRVLDENGDGVYDALQGSGDVNFNIDILLQDVDSDGYGDYASIPWAQASALGVDTSDKCTVADGDPQIWVPLADTTGDGIPDAIALDLNGDGVRDPQFLPGPIIAGPAHIGEAVPTLGEWTAILAALALAGVAWLQMRSHGIGA